MAGMRKLELPDVELSSQDEELRKFLHMINQGRSWVWYCMEKWHSQWKGSGNNRTAAEVKREDPVHTTGNGPG